MKDALIEVGSYPGELLYEAAAFPTDPTTTTTTDGSRLLALPFALLQEAVGFVGDARSTASLLCTNKQLAQAAHSYPDIWAAIPLVRVRCQGRVSTLTIDEHTGRAIVRGPGQWLRALEVICNPHPPITYAGQMRVSSFLPLLPRLRYLKVAYADFDEDTLSALLKLEELESLDIGSCVVRITNSRAPDWRALFTRLRTLTIRIPVAERLRLGDPALAILEGRATGLRALRLMAPDEPGSPNYVEALVFRVLVQWAGPQLEELGCDSCYTGPAIVNAIKGGHLPALRVLQLGNFKEDLVNDLLSALVGHAPALTCLRVRLSSRGAMPVSDNALLADLLRRASLEEFDALDWLLAEELDDGYSWRRSSSMSDTPGAVYAACFRSKTLRSLRVPEAAWDGLPTRQEYRVAVESREGLEGKGKAEEEEWFEGKEDGQEIMVLEVPAQLKRLMVVKGPAPGEFADGRFIMYYGDLGGAYAHDSGSECDYSGGDHDGEAPRIFRAPHLESCSLGCARDRFLGRLPYRLEFTALHELCLDLLFHKPYKTLALSEDGRLEEGEKWHKVLAVQAPQLSTFTILRASTLRVLRISSPTLRSLRLDDLPMLEALDVDAPFLDSLELEKAPQLRTLRLHSNVLHELKLGPCIDDTSCAASRPAAASASAAGPALASAAPPQPPKGAGKKRKGGWHCDSREQAAARAAERTRAAADLQLQPRPPLRVGLAHLHCAAQLSSLAVCCPHLEALRIEGATAFRGALVVARRGPRGEGLCCRLRSLSVRDCPGLTAVRLTGPDGVRKGQGPPAARARPPYVAPLREWALDRCPGVVEVAIDGDDGGGGGAPSGHVEAQAAEGSGGWVVAGAARRALDFLALQHRGVKVTLGGKALPGSGAGAAAGAQGPPSTLPWVRR